MIPTVETTISWSADDTPMGPLSIKSMNLSKILTKKDSERILDTIYDALQKLDYKPVDLRIGITCRMLESETDA